MFRLSCLVGLYTFKVCFVNQLLLNKMWILASSKKQTLPANVRPFTCFVTVKMWETLCLQLPSVLWRCWLGGRKGIWPVKNWVVGCWRGYLGWGAYLHMAQQMPLPLTISCSSKSRLVLPSWFLPFWYLLTRVVPDKFQKSSKTIVCVKSDTLNRLQERYIFHQPTLVWVSF